VLILPFPQCRNEIITFVKAHHYSRRCPGVWSVAYVIPRRNGQIKAVALYGPPPYPSIARAFCRDADHISKLIWQTRMTSSGGITKDDLDRLLAFANADLAARGYWWALTLTDPTSRVIDGALVALMQKGYTGEVYYRNDWLYLGITGSKKKLESFLIDGEQVHIRQGAITLTLDNVRQHYPDARSIRPIHGGAKSRWCYVFGNERERAERILLMKYRVQPFEAITQPRLLAQRWQGAWAHVR
jgi:hypothetical protein